MTDTEGTGGPGRWPGSTRSRVCGRAITMALGAAWVMGLAVPVGASQSPPEEPAYADMGARDLHRAAMAYHGAHVDRLAAYQATIQQRIGVRLRMPLKDRMLYRAETAHRVSWGRSGPILIEALGVREQAAARVENEKVDHGLIDHYYDPDRDRLLLGEREPGEASDPGDFSIEHPLEPEGAGSYGFASGDTLTLALPSGVRIRAVELRMSPHLRHPTRLEGSLWIDPATGALVRAAYRLSDQLDAVRDIEDLREEDARGEFRWVPGLFKPWTFEASLITVDYALWEGDVWVPRRWRAEGIMKAGVLEVPGELERSYRFAWVTAVPRQGEAVVAGGTNPLDAVPEGYRVLTQERQRGGRDIHLLVPRDPEVLRDSPDLPPPIWEEAPGFLSESEASDLRARLDRLPTAPAQSLPRSFRWGLQRKDLVRFNRVEELSVGARGAIMPNVAGHPLSLAATVRLGSGDLHPSARLDVTRASLLRTVSLSAYHELAATDETARHLGLGNSVMALAAGRDDGDYYRRTGARLALGPPPQRRPLYRVTAHSEYHHAVRPETRVSMARLWSPESWTFRPNVVAAEGWEHALTATLTPSVGTDPTGVQAGLIVSATGAVGDLEHARGSIAGRLAVPLGDRFRLGLSGAGGVATTDVPAQRTFAVGGPASLRGYEPRTLTGPCSVRSTLDLQRAFAFGGVSVFMDAGWAGTCSELAADRVLRSVGVGLSLVDGLVRADLARGLDGTRSLRFDLYLDGAF